MEMGTELEPGRVNRAIFLLGAARAYGKKVRISEIMREFKIGEA